MRKKLHIDPGILFALGGLISFLILMLFIFLSHGDLWNHFFFYDSIDVGMDFFHSIEYVKGRMPYLKFDTLYPPLANLFFLIIYYCVPIKVSELWADNFTDSISMRGTSADLRGYQSCFMLFIFFFLIVTILIIFLVQYMMKNRDQWKRNLISMAVVLSYGMLLSYERGNIIILVFLLSLFFVCFYKSDNRFLRETALIMLALSAGIKLYPAFLGILLLRDKQYKSSVRCIIYGIMTVVVPMFFFEEGISGLLQWIRIVMNFGSTNISPWQGNSFVNIEYGVKYLLQLLFKIELSDTLFGVIGLLITACLLLGALIQKEDWIAILMLVLAITMFQNQGDYIFILYLIPLLKYLEDNTESFSKYVVPILFVMILLWPIPLFHNQTGINSRNILSQVVLVILVGWSFMQSFYPLLYRKFNKISN